MECCWWFGVLLEWSVADAATSFRCPVGHSSWTTRRSTASEKTAEHNCGAKTYPGNQCVNVSVIKVTNNQRLYTQGFVAANNLFLYFKFYRTSFNKHWTPSITVRKLRASMKQLRWGRKTPDSLFYSQSAILYGRPISRPMWFIYNSCHLTDNIK